MIDQLLKKRVPELLRRMNRGQTLSVKKQERLINSLPNGKDDFEYAYNQYVCQRLYYGSLFYVVASIASMILLPYQFRKLRRTRSMLPECTKCELILVADDMPKGIFPEGLKQEFSSWIRVGAMDGYYFCESDEIFFRQLKERYWSHPYFLYKCLMKEAGYSYIIHKYKPLAICACGGEFTFTSSFLTAYCNSKSIMHFNTMHGEMFYYALDAFTHFDRFYVWDTYYIDLQKQLRCQSHYIVDIPSSVKIDLDNITMSDSKYYDIKYYLQLQEGKSLRKIADLLNSLEQRGYSVCVRYHPRTINIKEIHEIMPLIDIEDPNIVSISQSIKGTENVVAINSTVLFQAYISGKNAIIDDVSNEKLYRQLSERKYIMVGKCITISNYLNKRDRHGQ